MSQKLNSKMAGIGIDTARTRSIRSARIAVEPWCCGKSGPFSAVPRSARFARKRTRSSHLRSRTRPDYMARVADGSIRTATVADAPVIGFVHVEAWRESYVGIVPDHVLADLSVDRRAAMWGRILSDPSAPNASAAFAGSAAALSWGLAVAVCRETKC